MNAETKTQTQKKQTVTADRLTDTQATAIDLYKRGLNVFPLPSAYEWRARPEFEKDPNKKPPYMVAPLFYSRLHLCNEDCRHRALPLEYTFPALFIRANVGLMMGRTSNYLLAIDCDSQRSLETVGNDLERRSLPYWAISSHRGGAFLMRLIEGEAANLTEGKAIYKDVQIWGSRHYIVMPPSIHPLGTVYQWVTPEPRHCLPEGTNIPPVSVNALEWLGVTLRRGNYQEPELFSLGEWAAMLSYRNRETLAQGTIEGQRNSKLTAAAYDMAGNGIPYETSETAILQAAGNCVPEYPERDALAILKSAYSKPDVTPAREYYTNQNATVGLKAWQQAAEFAAVYDWRAVYGRKANSRRSVFLACVKRAQMENRPTFRASIRELGEILNRDYKRIAEVLHDLQDNGLLVYAGKSQSGANLYRFGDIVFQDYSQMPTVFPPCSNSVGNSEYSKIPETDAQKDAFSGLGMNAWRIWQYLLTKPSRSGYAIAKDAGLPVSSTYTALKRLQRYELVSYSQAEHLYYGESVTDSTFEHLSEQLGTYGKTEKLRARHRLERELRTNQQMARARKNYVTRQEVATNGTKHEST